MRSVRLLILLLLALFVTDVVMAAPAGLAMQLSSQKATGDMPCHMQQEDAGDHAGSQHDDHPAHQCHHCMACVVMMAAPALPSMRQAVLPPEIPFFSRDYRPQVVSPRLRPPILT